ncbi:MAG TPA: hypothetical protein QF873_02260 [Patescibacteria group bacterium]|nr:hypothetical protein [Patescibacteria group bacterium]|tara:strand:+ start:204 stop:470 length:267 start_codon:yes stop_codon:yes gene_type:complete
MRSRIVINGKRLFLAGASCTCELILACYALLMFSLAVTEAIDRNQICLMLFIGILIVAGPMKVFGDWLNIEALKVTRRVLGVTEDRGQ